MAKRRVVTSDIVWQKSFNSLSIEAMALFPKLLACSDDFGVLPADTEELTRLISPPKQIEDFAARIEEYVALEIFKRVKFKGKSFLVFEPDSFERHQSYFIKKRSKSEYLKIGRVDFDKHIRPLFQTFLEELSERSLYNIESRKENLESREEEVEEVKEEIDLDAPPTYESILRDIKDINENYGGTGDYDLRQFRGIMGKHTLSKVKEGVDYWGRKTKKVTPERLDDYLMGKVVAEPKFVEAHELEKKINGTPIATSRTKDVTATDFAAIAKHHEEREQRRAKRPGSYEATDHSPD